MHQSSSAHLAGAVGELVSPRDFALSNVIIDDKRYDYEGNWAFCRFDSPVVLGARFGFGRGAFDGSDYGGALLPKSSLLLHLELMLESGAVLWLATGQYDAGEVEIATHEMDIRLQRAGREVFQLNGWPQMRWHFQSDDGLAEVDMTADLKHVTILPDNVMQHNLFAMWLAVGDIKGKVRYQQEEHEVHGTIFYDHPRINIRRHDVPAFGRNLYTPMVFADGSLLVAHYTESSDGKRVDEYSFGAYIDAQGKGTWLPQTELVEVEYGADGKPRRWKQRWKTGDGQIEAQAEVRPTVVSKAWGGPNVPQTREANTNIPLVFDCHLSIMQGNDHQILHGGGLAEHIVCASWF